MSKNKSDVERAMETLTKALREEYAASQEIAVSDDGKIHLPAFMNAKDGSEALMKYYNSMEEQTEEIARFTGHLDDVLNAVTSAIEKSFGQALGKSQSFSFFGMEFLVPAQTQTITIAYGKTKVVPIGLVQVPGLPLTMDIGYKVNKDDVTRTNVDVTFNFKRMYQPLVDKIKKEANRILKEESIFQGKAINSDFTFMNLDAFDMSRVVYSMAERKNLNALLFNYVSDYQHFTRDLGLPTKRIILLTGRYGTGKTLTALNAAIKCRNSGWTFINVLPGHDFVNAINFAKRFQPCMVFFEDIDAATGTNKRDDRMNTILNTLDGTLAKDAKIVVVLTTNHLDRVNRAMIRPGRIDAVIEMGLMDQVALKGFVEVYIGKEVADSCNGDRLMEVASDFTPAFVVEALSRTHLYAKAEGRTTVNEEDVLFALSGVRAQYEEMIGSQTIQTSNIQTEFEGLVKAQTGALLDKAFDDFKAKLNPKVLLDN